jgi:hypothetical protein
LCSLRTSLAPLVARPRRTSGSRRTAISFFISFFYARSLASPPSPSLILHLRYKPLHFEKSVYQLREASACSVLYICAEHRGVARRVQVTAIIGLLACESVPDVQMCAAAALWALARNTTNRMMIGQLGGCRKLLDLLKNTGDIRCKEVSGGVNACTSYHR